MAPDIALIPSFTPVPTRGNFVLLRAGGLRLLLPQSDVGAAEYLQHRPLPGSTRGLLHSPDAADARVFAALSDHMDLLPECPHGRFVACALERTGHDVVWCWDELRVLIDMRLDPIALPRTLVTPHSAVHAYVELDGAPVFMCTARALVQYAMRQPEDPHAA